MLTPIERMYRAHQSRNRKRWAGYPSIHKLTLEEYTALTGGECVYCHAEAPNGIDRVDYRGGYTVENCVSCCPRCNSIKGGLERLFTPTEAQRRTRIRVTRDYYLDALLFTELVDWKPEKQPWRKRVAWSFWFHGYHGPYLTLRQVREAALRLLFP